MTHPVPHPAARDGRAAARREGGAGRWADKADALLRWSALLAAATLIAAVAEPLWASAPGPDQAATMPTPSAPR
jgi:hypothetical protein